MNAEIKSKKTNATQNHLRHFLSEMNFIMKKTFKKIAASVMAVAILSTGVTGILANAASANISISILSKNSGSWNADVDWKDDNEQKAYFNITSGGVSDPSHYLNFTLYSSSILSSTRLTNDTMINHIGTTTSDYIVYRGSGSYSYLYAKTDKSYQ